MYHQIRPLQVFIILMQCIVLFAIGVLALCIIVFLIASTKQLNPHPHSGIPKRNHDCDSRIGENTFFNVYRISMTHRDDRRKIQDCALQKYGWPVNVIPINGVEDPLPERGCIKAHINALERGIAHALKNASHLLYNKWILIMEDDFLPIVHWDELKTKMDDLVALPSLVSKVPKQSSTQAQQQSIVCPDGILFGRVQVPCQRSRTFGASKKCWARLTASKTTSAYAVTIEAAKKLIYCWRKTLSIEPDNWLSSVHAADVTWWTVLKSCVFVAPIKPIGGQFTSISDITHKLENYSDHDLRDLQTFL